ncbi:MAG TPA: dihydropteroate synthase [Candidatus Sulfotelmatobacter sp.]|nr:dihydropteroate synthase [Candidatus Sulfotelmatobacter sp.]
MKLRAGQFEFTFPRPALVMGIVNVTPDSFSDGGQFLDPEAAIAQGLKLVEQGADILDIGGESTRPRAVPVEEVEELRRVLPVVEGLAKRVAVPLSIDTWKPGVARAALRAGASIINDIGANRTEEAMWRLAAETGAGYVCMHMQGTPATMQAHPTYGDVVHEVGAFFFERLGRLHHCGVGREQIILDPGIGFGKTLEHNLQLLGNLQRFGRLECPVLLGVSRKSFMAKLLGATVDARLPAALACACLAIEMGVQMVRVHDVAETVQALRMTEAILARRNV